MKLGMKLNKEIKTLIDLVHYGCEIYKTTNPPMGFIVAVQLSKDVREQIYSELLATLINIRTIYAKDEGRAFCYVFVIAGIMFMIM